MLNLASHVLGISKNTHTLFRVRGENLQRRLWISSGVHVLCLELQIWRVAVSRMVASLSRLSSLLPRCSIRLLVFFSSDVTEQVTEVGVTSLF